MALACGVRPGVGDQYGVAVRCRLGDIVRSKRSFRARLRFHQHGLAQARCELLGDNAPEEIGRPSRRVRNDEADRLAWVGGLRPDGGRRQEPGQREKGKTSVAKGVHGVVVLVIMAIRA